MKAKVIANGVRLHKSSSAYSDAVGFAERGSELDIEAEYGEWCKLTDGRWVEAAYTEPIDTGTSWNDLADKPFYAEEMNIITWDGDRTGLECINTNMPPIGLYGPFEFNGTVEDLRGATVLIGHDGNVGRSYVISDSNAKWNDDGTGMTLYTKGQLSEPELVFTTEDNAVVPWINEDHPKTIQTAGLWIWYGGSGSHVFEVSKSVTVKLDDKFLTQSDWNESDPESAAYVKNRPFYESKTNIRTLVDETVTITQGYYSNDQFYYEADWSFSVDQTKAYDITFLGETFEGVVGNPYNLVVTLSNGAVVSFSGSSITSQEGDGLTRPFTTDVKIVEYDHKIKQLDEKFIADSVIPKTGPFFARCTTAAGTVNKTATTSGDYHLTELRAGAMVAVSFNSSTSTTMTLDVDGTGAKNVHLSSNGFSDLSEVNPIKGKHIFVYDGSTWTLFV